MENSTRETAPTFDSVWAFIQETARIQRENERILNEKFAATDRKMQENARIQRENERILNEKFAETDRRMRIMQKEMGSWANNHGAFAEDYFFNSFENDEQYFFGERFDKIRKNLYSISENLEDEYDIVMYNGTSVAIIEVKFRAHKDHIQKLIEKAETFRILFPGYNNYKIYLALASLSFHSGVEKDCIDQGIAVVKQLGDKAVIYDEHLKVW